MSKMVNAGIVTAYGAAVRGGYEGTYTQFCADLGKLADVLSEFLGFSVSIETLAEGEQATANYDGGILSLGIPRGNTGNGIQSIVLNADYTLTVTYTNGNTWTSGSIRGQVGATPHLTIGTVQTLEPGQSATAEITGTDEDPILNLGIPKGQAGASDAGGVSYDPEGSYDEGTVGAELQEQTRQLNYDATKLSNEIGVDIITDFALNNGTVANSGNSYCVCTDYIPIGVGEVTIDVLKPLTKENYFYSFGYRLYREDKSASGGYVDFDYSADYNKKLKITNSNIKYVRFTIFEGVSASDYATLRKEQFSVGDVVVYYNSEYLSDIARQSKITKTIIETPYIYNGLPGNSGNANAVCIRNVPFRSDVKAINIKNTRPLSADGNYYVYDLTTSLDGSYYNSKEFDITLGGDESFTFTTKYLKSSNTQINGFGFAVSEKTSDGTFVPLRQSSYDGYALIVRFYYEDDICNFDDRNIDESYHLMVSAKKIPNSNDESFTLLHFSDLHKDTRALNRIVEAVKKYNRYQLVVQDSICTGDIVANTAEEISSWWDKSIMTCIGNHDTASYSDGAYNWTALSMADRDEYYIAPFESNWGITHTSGTSYYYKDYSAQKVRLIVMDGMLYNDNGEETAAQTAWLVNLLSDAITNNLHVLIAIHAPHGGATAEDCSFSKYNATTMPTLTDCNTPQVVIDAVAEKITAGLHFIGYICGHTHQDNIWDAENDGKQLMFCITCASTLPAQSRISDLYRTEGSFSYVQMYDAYNLISVDTTNTLVKIVRGGGADIDDHMRTRKAICFNYSTGEKVGEVL